MVHKGYAIYTFIYIYISIYPYIHIYAVGIKQGDGAPSSGRGQDDLSINHYYCFSAPKLPCSHRCPVRHVDSCKQLCVPNIHSLLFVVLVFRCFQDRHLRITERKEKERGKYVLWKMTREQQEPNTRTTGKNRGEGGKKRNEKT